MFFFIRRSIDKTDPLIQNPVSFLIAWPCYMLVVLVGNICVGGSKLTGKIPVRQTKVIKPKNEVFNPYEQ